MNEFGLTINKCLNQIKYIRKTYKQEQQKLENIAFLGGRAYSNLLWYPLMNSMLLKVIQDEERANQQSSNLNLIAVPKRLRLNSGDHLAQRELRGRFPIDYRPKTSYNYRNGVLKINSAVRIPVSEPLTNRGHGHLIESITLEEPEEYNFKSGSSNRQANIKNNNNDEELPVQCNTKSVRNNENSKTADVYSSPQILERAVNINLNAINYQPTKNGVMTRNIRQRLKKSSKNWGSVDEMVPATNLLSLVGVTQISPCKNIKRNENCTGGSKPKANNPKSLNDNLESEQSIDLKSLMSTKPPIVALNSNHQRNVDIVDENTSKKNVPLANLKIKMNHASTAVSENHEHFIKQNISVESPQAKIESGQIGRNGNSENLKAELSSGQIEKSETLNRVLNEKGFPEKIDDCKQERHNVEATEDLKQKSKSLMKYNLAKIVVDFIDETLNKPELEDNQKTNECVITSRNESEKGQSLLEAKLQFAAKSHIKSCCNRDTTSSVCTPICDVTSRLRLCAIMKPPNEYLLANNSDILADNICCCESLRKMEEVNAERDLKLLRKASRKNVMIGDTNVKSMSATCQTEFLKRVPNVVEQQTQGKIREPGQNLNDTYHIAEKEILTNTSVATMSKITASDEQGNTKNSVSIPLDLTAFQKESVLLEIKLLQPLFSIELRKAPKDIKKLGLTNFENDSELSHHDEDDIDRHSFEESTIESSTEKCTMTDNANANHANETIPPNSRNKRQAERVQGTFPLIKKNEEDTFSSRIESSNSKPNTENDDNEIKVSKDQKESINSMAFIILVIKVTSTRLQ
ncbi:putative leucine-rich repeat-containing protein DDB_G0290503 [Neodiprion pinetum]|uniref:putative leucine-rich repeat-containing protein DDB_G0290503 n=1 Tax=Neodiprion pinetum TaxID=441929 RepID=UPI003719A92D